MSRFQSDLKFPPTSWYSLTHFKWWNNISPQILKKTQSRVKMCERGCFSALLYVQAWWQALRGNHDRCAIAKTPLAQLLISSFNPTGEQRRGEENSEEKRSFVLICHCWFFSPTQWPASYSLTVVWRLSRSGSNSKLKTSIYSQLIVLFFYS